MSWEHRARRARSMTIGDRPMVRVRRLPSGGLGVFATRPIRDGNRVLTFGGARVRFEEIADFTHCLEIEPGLFLGPSGEADDYVNHSCEPNCVVSCEGSDVILVAQRHIARGEELTFDYATMMITDPTTFPCGCGSPSCRGVVARVDAQVMAFPAVPTEPPEPVTSFAR